MQTIAIELQLADGTAVSRTIAARSIVVGSDAACDLVIAETAPRHARVLVRARDGAVVIRPLGDASVMVNGMVVTEPTVIGADDRVQLGDARLTLRAAGDGRRRWWDPRALVTTFGEGWSDRARPAPPRPTMNPPAPPPEPEPPRPPIDLGRTWNPPAPRPTDLPRPPANPPPILYNPPRPRREPLPRAARATTLADDPTEHRLLAALRDAPADDGARLVYADWLESRGRGAFAAAVRGDAIADRAAVARESTPLARAVAACASLHGCTRTTCPERWQALAPCADADAQRTCGRCDARVYFASTRAEVAAVRSNDLPAALDPVLEPA